MIAGLLSLAALALGAAGVTFISARRAPAAPQREVVTVTEKVDAARLPADRVVLDAADEAECRGGGKATAALHTRTPETPA